MYRYEQNAIFWKLFDAAAMTITILNFRNK